LNPAISRTTALTAPIPSPARLLCASALLAATLSCAHPNRVSQHALDRLTKKREHFVLVFGSLTTPKGQLRNPAIRFLHQNNSGTTDAVLWSMTISSGDRFYAILHAPAAAPYLDSFYTEVGAEKPGYDGVLFARLREGQEPLAMYIGEMEVRPAPVRYAQGQNVIVDRRDDFQNAEKELRRLYPRFDGPVIKMTLASNSPGARPITIPR